VAEDKDATSASDPHPPTAHSDAPSRRPPDPTPPDAPGVDEDATYKRRVAVLLAALAVGGAWIGILQVNAAVHEANTARETTRMAVRAQASAVVEDAVLRLREQVDAEAGTLTSRPTYTLDPSQIPELAGLDPRERRAAAQAEIRRALRRDPAALQDLRRTARRQSLTRAALTDERIAWKAQAAQYRTVLTTLAVALFLVGFTLVLAPGIRAVVLVPGLALAAYCFGWAVVIDVRPVPSTPPDAIAHTAEGQVLLADGRTAQAITAFDAAVAADPAYVTAYEDRALAHFLAANPDFFATGAITDTDSAAFRAALRDVRRALDLGGDQDVTTLAVAGVLAFADGDLDAAANRLTSAVGLNERAPGIGLYLSAVETARGNDAAADRWRDRALGELDAGERGSRTRQLAAAYVTALEWIAHELPGRAGAAMRQRDEAIALEMSAVFGESMSGVAPADATIDVDRITVADGAVRFDLDVGGVAPGDPVAVLVFERPTPDGPWVQPPAESYVGPFRIRDGPTPRVPVDRDCLPTAFRVDLYVRGARADSATAPGTDASC
jgi:tetratricopeptide (TPR) repeat protein